MIPGALSHKLPLVHVDSRLLHVTIHRKGGSLHGKKRVARDLICQRPGLSGSAGEGGPGKGSDCSYPTPFLCFKYVGSLYSTAFTCDNCFNSKRDLQKVLRQIITVQEGSGAELLKQEPASFIPGGNPVRRGTAFN